MARWLVGVDAGGTNTRAVAMDPESGQRREARSEEGANWTVHGPELCRERIGRAVSEAIPNREQPAALSVGIAGYYPPDHQLAVDAWASETWPGSIVRVVPDVVAAWAGAHGGEPGIVVICGTGSIGYGRNAAGDEARAGGWGPLFGDEGSAYWIGVTCLRQLSRVVDGINSPTGLVDRVMAAWPELGADLRTWLRGVYRHQWGREQVAALAQEVVEAAEAGDSIATTVVDLAAVQLRELADVVRFRLGGGGYRLAVQGGLGESVVGERLREMVNRHPLGLTAVHPQFSPLEGALLLAAEAVGGPDELRRVRESLM